MKDVTLRHLDMGRRVTDFTDTHTASIPAGSRAAALVVTITEAVTELEIQGAKQDAAELDGRQATDQKDAALLNLANLMRPINRTARGMEKLRPGITARFRTPRGSNQNYLNRARAYIEEATPMAADFTGRGLPADFLTTLEVAAVTLEETITRQNAALTAKTAATAALAAAQRKLTDAVREFSPIVINIFANDPAVLASWESARHVQRAPKKTKPAPPTPPTP